MALSTLLSSAQSLVAQNKTIVTVQIGDPPFEYSDVLEYEIDSNVLTLMDTFTVRFANPSGVLADDFVIGDPISIYMSDPSVSAGQKTLIMKGRVLGRDDEADAGGGTVTTVSGGDLGWHLTDTDGPLFKVVMNMTWANFIKLILEPQWGFSGVRTDNDFNLALQQGLKLNQGRAAIAAARAPVDVFIPPVCFEAGEVIADKLITYARRVKRLVNVSGDGYLQIFKPNDSGDVDYVLHFHKPTEQARSQNNVKGPVRRRRAIDTMYTDVTCLGQVAVPSVLPDRFNPHAGTIRGHYANASVLPFPRPFSFGESDAMTQSFADDRAKWKFNRGMFDAETMTYEAIGHVNSGKFYAADACCGVDDTVYGIREKRYVSARRFRRSKASGTTTTLTVHRTGLLSA